MWNNYFNLIVNYIYNSNKIIAIETDKMDTILDINNATYLLIRKNNIIGKPLSNFFSISESKIPMNCKDGFNKIQMSYISEKRFDLTLSACSVEIDNKRLYLAEDISENEASLIEKIGEVNLELSNLAREVHKKNRDLESKNNIITSLMLQDPLTKLNNRRYLYEKFDTLSSMFRTKSIDTITMAIIDIDNFKTINDTYGHDIGDEVLIVFSNLIKSISRENDLKIRFGGDEFVVILINANLSVTMERMKQLKYEFANAQIESVDLPLTTSIGIVQYKEFESFHDFIVRADKLLYKAKELGKNTIVSEDQGL